MQTISRVFFGFLACVSLVLLVGTNAFSQHNVAADNISKLPVAAASSEPNGSDKTPFTDT